MRHAFLFGGLGWAGWRWIMWVSVMGWMMACEAKEAAGERRPRVLLRSSWQVVNIGDIAHTPGVLALVEKHLPEAEVRLWASGDLSPEVSAMEQRRFPSLKIVKGSITGPGQASQPDLAQAVEWADFLLHGSGPSLVATDDVAAWVEHTGKPYGVYGITYGPPVSQKSHRLLSQAQFVFFRDSKSLQWAVEQGVAAPVMKWAPDGAFACDLADEEKAESYLKSVGLESGKFLCCLSRLRKTPYWKVPGRKVDPEQEKKHRRNEEMKEADHAALRQAIIAVTEQTSYKVLLCPEDVTQVELSREMFYDRLPGAVKSRVVWRDRFWLTDEALSVYRRSAGLFGSEMHSPIMAVGRGVPAVVCRFAEQTTKGYMWQDIGMGEWLFDLDEPMDHGRVVPTVLGLVLEREKALSLTETARQKVELHQRETMAEVRRAVLASVKSRSSGR